VIGCAVLALAEQTLSAAVLQPAAERLVDALCDLMQRHATSIPLMSVTLDVSALRLYICSIDCAQWMCVSYVRCM
jgi:hypothetical protein